MRVDNINWHPIRVEAKRIANNTYEISRGGELRGTIEKLDDGWKTTVTGRHVYYAKHRTSSFKTAVLTLCRLHMTPSSDGPQDHGEIRTIRVNVATVWYTVMFHKHGTWVLQDSFGKDSMNDLQQARLRTVLSEAAKFKANL
jgi:hypothetical protein